MEMLQGLVLPFFPHWRIVPSPPIDAVTEDPKLVSPLFIAFDMPKGTAISDPAEILSLLWASQSYENKLSTAVTLLRTANRCLK